MRRLRLRLVNFVLARRLRKEIEDAFNQRHDFLQVILREEALVYLHNRFEQRDEELRKLEGQLRALGSAVPPEQKRLVGDMRRYVEELVTWR